MRYFLEHRPIKARRPTLVERVAKWTRRHRTIVASAVVIAVLAAVGLGVTMVLIGRERAEAVRQRDRTFHQRYVADIRQAYQLVRNGQGTEARDVLNRWRPSPGEPDQRNFAWYYLRRLCHDERRSLRGHKGGVYHAEFSPDGRTLASCGQDGTVRLWEVATGRPLRTITASATEVNWVDFAPDGRTLATVSDDGSIKLWDVGTGSEQATIPAHKGDAIAVRFLPNGRLVSAGRTDSLVKLWDLTTLMELASARAHKAPLEFLALAPDRTTLATAGGDGYARLWNLADLSHRKSLFVQQGFVYSLDFSADGTRLATADSGGRLRMWNLPSGAAREGFQGSAHDDDVQAVAFLAEDRLVVSADGHGFLRLSDANTGTSLATLNGHTGKIWGISVSPDGTTFATVGSDGTVKLWDARLPQRWLAIPVPNHGGSIAFTPDGQVLIVANVVGKFFQPPSGTPAFIDDANLEVIGLDPKTGAKRFHHILDRRQATYGASLSRDGALALLHRVDGTTTSWEVATGKRLLTINQWVGPARSRFVWVRPPKGPFELVDAATGRSRALRGTESATYVALAPDARIVLVRSPDELAIWDLSTNRARRTRQGVRAEWTAATFSPDATILATGATMPRRVIQLWDVNTLELLDSLLGNTANVDSLDFSPDGRVLASLNRDRVVKLWDVAAGAELLTLQGPFHPSYQVCFSPDGRTLAFYSDADGKGWVYLLSTELPEDLASEEGP